MNFLSIDLEDWFHILGSKYYGEPDNWFTFPSIVVKETIKLLEFLENHDTHATFFLVGWICEQYPEIIQEIVHRGHEIGAHSHFHRINYELTDQQFEVDLIRNMTAIFKSCGRTVDLYRSPSFSIKQRNLHHLALLKKNGIERDSSLFLGKRDNGGIVANFPSSVFKLEAAIKGREFSIIEFPINTVNIAANISICAGGGYFRIMPYKILKKFLTKSNYNMIYLHPRDFSDNIPRFMDQSLMRRFKLSYGTSQTFNKLSKLIGEFKLNTLNDFSYEDPMPCIHLER